MKKNNPYPLPHTGGSYTRHPKTGALTKHKPAPQKEAQ